VDFFNAILGDLSIPFVLTPTDKIAYWFEKENEKHLFGTDLCSANDEYSDDEQNELRDSLYLGLDNKFGTNFDGEWSAAPNGRDFDGLYDEIFGTKKVAEVIPTLDELLDKINVGGIKSLTEKEKQFLNNYSK